MVGKVDMLVCMLVGRLLDMQVRRCWLLGRQVSRLGSVRQVGRKIGR